MELPMSTSLVEEMIVQVLTDEELKKLLEETGFIINVDYPTKDVKVHRISCPRVNPDKPGGAKPSSKTLNKTGKFWYSENHNEILQKAKEVANTRKFKVALCIICNP
jgi:hypothetical protein